MMEACVRGGDEHELALGAGGRTDMNRDIRVIITELNFAPG